MQEQKGMLGSDQVMSWVLHLQLVQVAASAAELKANS